MKKITEDVFIEMIDKQLELNGYKERFADIQKIENWFIKFKTNNEIEAEYREYLDDKLKKYIRNKALRQKEIEFFILNYGLSNTDGI